MGKKDLCQSMQNMPVQEWRGTERESLGDVLCVSKVKLQHLPFQVGHICGEQPPIGAAQKRQWMEGAAQTPAYPLPPTLKGPSTHIPLNGRRFVPAPVAQPRGLGTARA